MKDEQKKKRTVLNADGFPLPAKGNDKFKVHVISGTHWDREWRFNAAQSKLRLTELVDKVINTLENSEDYHHFVLDGGSVILEDYLTIRPENKSRLEKLIRGGRISVVNFYTLPELNIVSPEAIVRNILIGRRIAREFGGAMKAGYTATSYGQPAQLPQIYHNFGIETAIFYRGLNKHVVPPVSRWESPDGSEVVLVRCFDEWNRSNWMYYAFLPMIFGRTDEKVPLSLLQYHYDPKFLPVHMADQELYRDSFWSINEKIGFPSDREMLLDRYQTFKNHAYQYAIGRHVLGLDMEDNALPKDCQPQLIKALNDTLEDSEIVHSSVDEYIADILIEIDGIKLHKTKGEMRNTAIECGWNGLYGLTGSSRVQMKLANERAETSLILVTEPLAVIANALGAEYPRTALNEAWLTLLKNHAHDSICGASADDVHLDMLYRFRQVKSLADGISKIALGAIWQQINVPSSNENDQSVTIFNTMPFQRNITQMFVLDLPKAHFHNPGHSRILKGVTDRDLFDILDEDGKIVPYEIIDVQDISIHCESPVQSSGASIPAKRHRIVLSTQLPSLGYRTFTIRKREPKYIFDPQPIVQRSLIAKPGGILENGSLKVTINSNGTFDLTDKKHKRIFENLHYFQDQVSTGHSHIDSNTIVDNTVTSLGLQTVITMIESNSLRGVYRIDWKMPVPKEAIGDWYRLNDTVDLPINTWLTLTKNAKRLDIRTKINNTALDHRLRVMFPTGIKTDQVSVETAFRVEERQILPRDVGDNIEPHYIYQPMQNFIDMYDEKSGLAILNTGIREYAICDDDDRTASLTLFRTYRPYVNATNNMTPEEKAKQLGSHSPGEFEFTYALYPHTGDWLKGNVIAEAYDHKTPLRAIQGPPKKGILPQSHSFLKIDPQDKIMFSGFCQAENGTDSILRIWNITDETLNATLETTLPFTSVYQINMAEDKDLQKLPLKNNSLSLTMRPAEIVTLRFKK